MSSASDPHSALQTVLHLLASNTDIIQPSQAIQALLITCRYINSLLDANLTACKPSTQLLTALSAVGKLLSSQKRGWLHNSPTTTAGVEKVAFIEEVTEENQVVEETFLLAASLARSHCLASIVDLQCERQVDHILNSLYRAECIDPASQNLRDWLLDRSLHIAPQLRAKLDRSYGQTERQLQASEDVPVAERYMAARSVMWLLGIAICPTMCPLMHSQQPHRDSLDSNGETSAVSGSIGEIAVGAEGLMRDSMQRLMPLLELALKDSSSNVQGLAFRFLSSLANSQNAQQTDGQIHSQNTPQMDGHIDRHLLQPSVPELAAGLRRAVESTDEATWEHAAEAAVSFTCFVAGDNPRDIDLQRLMCAMLDVAERIAHKSNSACAWLKVVPPLIQALKLVNVLLFARLMPFLLEWIATPQPALQTSALGALYDVIRVTWPRMSAHVAFLRSHVRPCAEVSGNEGVRVAGNRVLDLLDVVEKQCVVADGSVVDLVD